MNKKILLTITVCFLLAGCAKEHIAQQIGQSPAASTPTSSADPPESAASSTSTLSDSATSSAQLKAILAKYTTQQIVFFQSITIGDKQNAAFAIVYEGDVWYITTSGAQKLKSNLAFRADHQFDAPFPFSQLIRSEFMELLLL